jgi:hypothetical protein
MQKGLLLFLLFIAAARISHAQVNKGAYLIGGDISFNALSSSSPSANNAHNDTKNLSLSPSFGKAIAPNLVFGIELSYFTAQSKDIATGSPVTSAISKSYGAGFFLREYKALGKGFSISTQENLVGAYATATNNDIQNGRGYSVSFVFTPGLSYAITPRIQLETSLQNLFFITYAHQKLGTDASNYTYQHDISVGTNLSNTFTSLVLGIRFLLNN